MSVPSTLSSLSLLPILNGLIKQQNHYKFLDVLHIPHTLLLIWGHFSFVCGCFFLFCHGVMISILAFLSHFPFLLSISPSSSPVIFFSPCSLLSPCTYQIFFYFKSSILVSLLFWRPKEVLDYMFLESVCLFLLILK